MEKQSGELRENSRQDTGRDTGRKNPGGGAETMRAVVYRSYGGPEVLEYSVVPRPKPRPGTVLVRVRAAGLDRGTWHLMAGEPRAARLAAGLRAPRNPIPGIDFAGEIVALGAGVAGFAPGDKVLGVAAGSFAEYVVAGTNKLAHLPEGIPWEQAAALPTSGVTAYQALAKVGGLNGQTHILVTGASGGVGSFAVQLAKLRGAKVSAECSAAKTNYVAALGADTVRDQVSGAAYSADSSYDVVIDIGGNPSIATLRRVLAPRGHAVIVGAETPGSSLIGVGRQMRAAMLSPFLRQKFSMLVSVNKPEDLAALVELLSTGALECKIDKVYTLERAREAMEYLVARKVRGKIVLVP